jgi:aminopeptidase
MDQRIRDHAETLVDWSARVEAGDDVVLRVGEGAHDLAVAVAEQLGARGANVVPVYRSEEVTRAYLTASEGDFDADPAYELSLYEGADSVLSLRGSRNVTAGADVPGETRQAYARARAGIREARMATDWVSTVHPTRALAQQAGMSFPAYREFVYDAVLRDWGSLADEMARLKALLDDGTQVRIRKEPGDDEPATDLTLSIADRTAVNSAASVAYDSHNLPSGEVFTAPVADSVSGTVHFDVAMTIDSQAVRDVTLEFDGGEVVGFDAGAGESVVADTLETDDGARRLGELGVGMNRGIDRPTGQILFDEKMAGTVHLALGRAYSACLPDGETGNESAVHVDLITDMRQPGTALLVDGDVVQRDGTFRWEDGFEG